MPGNGVSFAVVDDDVMDVDSGGDGDASVVFKDLSAGFAICWATLDKLFETGSRSGSESITSFELTPSSILSDSFWGVSPPFGSTT